MTWQDVCADPLLKDLPYKIELNRFGQIVMSPASNQHGDFQERIAAALIPFLPGGRVLVESSIETCDGTKVADVAGLSAQFLERHGMITPFPEAPDICVEVVSPSNAVAELEEKARLYFAAGAREVWFCDESGRVTFHEPDGEIPLSKVAPEFPSQV